LSGRGRGRGFRGKGRGGCPRGFCPFGPGPVGKIFGARFIKDVTLFNGIEVNPDSTLTKIWKLRNPNEEPWPEKLFVEFVGGDDISTGHFSVIRFEKPVQKDEEVEVSIDIKSPSLAGRYVSFFRLALSQDSSTRFGQRFKVELNVVNEDSIPAVVPEDFAYSPQLRTLVQCGFENIPQNIQLLNEFQGDLQTVIHAIVSQQEEEEEE
jgi:hypothetical protein